LDWSLSEGEEELASDVEQEQGVLSGLEPPSQIESLVIRRYQGPCLPRWLMEQNGSSYSEGTTLRTYEISFAEVPQTVGNGKFRGAVDYSKRYRNSRGGIKCTILLPCPIEPIYNGLPAIECCGL